MHFDVPPDLEIMVRKRIATGGFENAEEVFRYALQSLDADENWTTDERLALDDKIDSALKQAVAGNVFGPDEARQKLASMRAIHLTGLSG